MSAPTGTPTPIPAFAPAEREAEDVVGAVVVGEGVEDVAGIVVELKELEVDVPTIPMVVNATTPPSKVVTLTPVVQLQADG